MAEQKPDLLVIWRSRNDTVCRSRHGHNAPAADIAGMTKHLAHASQAITIDRGSAVEGDSGLSHSIRGV